ncbi:MAG: FHA domain-containing protein [Anaerolineae bacterium]|nr:FHA domain-containing protein [Anaerolineae bacterium]
MTFGKLVEQETGEWFPLGNDVITIGRYSENDIVLADPQASRHHAEIIREARRWVLHDLDSANGTFVNGRRITTPSVLRHGDLVRIGRIQLQVELPAAIAGQDTLVERIVPVAAAPSRGRARLPLLLVAILALAAAAALFFLLLLPRFRPDDQETVPTPAIQSPVAVAPTDLVTPTATLPAAASPTATELPTVAPPSPTDTVPPPTLAPPPPTDTPSVLPSIGFFRAQPSAIQEGECTRLEWGNVDNATRLVLSDVGPVAPEGRIDVCLDTSRTYTLRASGPGGGEAAQSITVSVAPATRAVIEYFHVVPAIIAPGACAELEWGLVKNAIEAVIEPGLGGVATPGKAEVCPTTTTRYVLTARDAQGERSAAATLVVSTEGAPQPVIAFFTANPVRIVAGECTTLEWGKVDYAAAVTIDHDIGGVATPGSQEICPARTTTYLMTAVGEGGRTEQSVTVTVSPGELADLPDLVVESIRFDPNPCFRTHNCKVRVTIRNDGSRDADHFVVRWSLVGDQAVPVEWDLPGLDAGEIKELSYTWIPATTGDELSTRAIVDPNEEVDEIEEGADNTLEQVITVLRP